MGFPKMSHKHCVTFLCDYVHVTPATVLEVNGVAAHEVPETRWIYTKGQTVTLGSVRRAREFVKAHGPNVCRLATDDTDD